MSHIYFWFFVGLGTIAFLGCIMLSIYFSRIRRLHYSDRISIWLFSATRLALLNILAIIIFGLIIWVFQSASGIVIYEAENDTLGIIKAFTSLIFSLSLACIVVVGIDICIYRVLSLKFKESTATAQFGYWLPVLTTLSILLIVITATNIVSERQTKRQDQREQVARQNLLRLVVIPLEKELGSISKAPCPNPASNSYNLPIACYPIDGTVTTVRAAADHALNSQAIQSGEWNDYGWYSSGSYRLRDSSQFNVLISYTPKNDQWLASENDGEYWGPYRPHKALLEIVIQ